MGSSLRSSSVAIALAVSLASSAVAARPAWAQAVEEPIVVVDRDGERIEGTLVATFEDGWLIRRGGQLIRIPFEGAQRLVVEAPPAPASTGSGWWTPQAAGSAGIEPSRRWRGTAEWEKYRRARLVLVDRDGGRIGPARYGFDDRDFGREDDEAYMVLRGDDGDPLSILEFVDLADDEDLSAVLRHRLLKYKSLRDFGLGTMVFAGVMGVGGLLARAAYDGSVRSDPETGAVYSADGRLQYGAGALFGASNPVFFLGGYAALWGGGRLNRYRGTQLHRLLDRPAAWRHVQRWNAERWQEAGLPDDEALDGR
jgi:hypothetical protein